MNAAAGGRGGRIVLVCRRRRFASLNRRRGRRPVSERIFAQGRAGMRADSARAAAWRHVGDGSGYRQGAQGAERGARRRQNSTETTQHGQERSREDPRKRRSRARIGVGLPSDAVCLARSGAGAAGNVSRFPGCHIRTSCMRLPSKPTKAGWRPTAISKWTPQRAAPQKAMPQ